MKRNDLIEYLKEEYNYEFKGWDFTHLQGRMIEDIYPWSYLEKINKYLVGKDTLLDIDTGGGEFLSSIKKLPKHTYATEAYEPNIPIATKLLQKQGVIVAGVKNNDLLPFKDNFFDIIINRHGTYNSTEINRLLKNNGLFITQQVGGLNTIDLNLSLGCLTNFNTDWGLVKNIIDFSSKGLNVIESNEYIGKYRFYDIGAIVYYLKCIPWQITDFSVNNYIEQLEVIAKIIERNGFIDFIAHRFYIIVK